MAWVGGGAFASCVGRQKEEKEVLHIHMKEKGSEAMMGRLQRDLSHHDGVYGPAG